MNLSLYFLKLKIKRRFDIMFAGFNLDNLDNKFFGDKFEYYEKIGKQHLTSVEGDIYTTLSSYIKSGTTDGTKLQNDWFPKINADIFISHSHKDEQLANALSGWLYSEFKLRCFVDSNMWRNMNTLLEDINDTFSNKRPDGNGGKIYDHKLCKIASTHVNMMLNIALQKMIDKTEVVILLNTVNSINKYEDHLQESKLSTYSSWIYSEIICTEIIRKQPLSEYRRADKIENSFYFSENLRNLEIEYDIELSHLQKITPSDLKNWNAQWDSKYIPLDLLYIITIPQKVNDLSEFYDKF